MQKAVPLVCDVLPYIASWQRCGCHCGGTQAQANPGTSPAASEWAASHGRKQSWGKSRGVNVSICSIAQVVERVRQKAAIYGQEIGEAPAAVNGGMQHAGADASSSQQHCSSSRFRTCLRMLCAFWLWHVWMCLILPT